MRLSDDCLEVKSELDCETGSVRHYLFTMWGFAQVR